MKEAGGDGNDVADEDIVGPDVLYKYCVFNEYTERIFTHNEIYFSSPDEFNDLIDSKPHLTCGNTRQEREDFFRKYYQGKCPEQSRKEISAIVQKIMTEGEDTVVLREILERSIDGLRKRLSICCFTEIRDNVLMWAHYAKQHTGFCLEFDAKNYCYRPSPRALKVNYDKFRPEFNVLKLDSYPEGIRPTKYTPSNNDKRTAILPPTASLDDVVLSQKVPRVVYGDLLASPVPP
jgi:hypothetical protein